ncbi:MAG: hypothetical protein K5644_08815 [Lachnospiraceae bacterium]|nr:hypothetical protein [Lachnospiraceae bacterium]
MSRVITILEISQKQAYIYGSNKLKENIVNSSVIAYVLSAEYIEKILSDMGYKDKENMVYAGGGHTILTFCDETPQKALEKSKNCVERLTMTIYRDFDGLNVFAKAKVYDESKTVGENLKDLVALLESKKAIRKSAFKKGSFGIEKTDATTLQPKKSSDSAKESKEKKLVRKAEEEKALPKSIKESGYKPVYKFENLGGSKNESNFIAVVHIDGNGMGKRVENLYKSIESDKTDNEDTFEENKQKLREFSECIDADFLSAYEDMLEDVKKEISENENIKQTLSLKKNKDDKIYFPVRRVVVAGDDICFITEGRIGVECAVKFIEALNTKKNKVDGLGYAACAGVAIVHQKYPFYRAYELAESLCSNAKSFNATVHGEDNGQSISSIDWHIEFGEMGDSLEEIRENYVSYDGIRLNIRPYIISGANNLAGDIELYHDYKKFKNNFTRLTKKGASLATSKMKELRRALREGEDETLFYLESGSMTDVIFPNMEFFEDYDSKRASYSFDAIEIMDTYLPFEN